MGVLHPQLSNCSFFSLGTLDKPPLWHDGFTLNFGRCLLLSQQTAHFFLLSTWGVAEPPILRSCFWGVLGCKAFSIYVLLQDGPRHQLQIVGAHFTLLLRGEITPVTH